MDKLKTDVIDNGLVVAGVELKPEREELYIQ